jgi:RimJ/RimL family protein N-acetyltransferase
MMEGRLVRLAPLREEDAEPLFRWINDRELVVLNAPFKSVEWDEHRHWFERIRNAPDVEIFGVRRRDDDGLIGSCQLNRIDARRRRCSLQIRIGERDAWGKGYGTEAVRLLVDHAFRDLGLRRVELEVFAHNERAIRTYRKVGFREQRVKKAAAVIDGEPVDAIVMAIGDEARPQLTRRLVAIHQPNFFPWLGYFDKLARADVFVLLDDVQFPKKGGTWINRVRLLIDEEPAWVTVPVVRSYHGVRQIREMRIDEQTPWRRKLLKTIQASYARAPHKDEVMPVLSELIGNPTDELAEYNGASIAALTEAVGLTTDVVHSSSLGVTGRATERLIELVKAVGGSSYLSGGGAGGYQEDERFSDAGIELVQQGFEPPTYPQLASAPVPGLSVIDALLNCGFEGTRRLLDSAGRT